MKPQIDISTFDVAELQTLHEWRLIKGVDTYNRENAPLTAKERLERLIDAIPRIRNEKWPIGPSDNYERALLDRFLGVLKHTHLEFIKTH